MIFYVASKYMVTDVSSNSDEGMSYNALKKMLMELMGFSLDDSVGILNLARLHPAIYVDESNKSFRVISNSHKKFNVNGLFQRMFGDMAKTNNVDAFSNSAKNFAVKDFKYNEMNMQSAPRNKNDKKG